jgi:hypothetical protein
MDSGGMDREGMDGGGMDRPREDATTWTMPPTAAPTAETCTEAFCKERTIPEYEYGSDEQAPEYPKVQSAQAASDACSAGICDVEKCCGAERSCIDGSFMCPEATHMANETRGYEEVCKYSECTVEECCIKRPKCTTSLCADNQVLKSDSDSVVCGKKCYWSECCVSRGRCSSYESKPQIACSLDEEATHFNRGELDPGFMCAGEECTKAECCLAKGTCANVCDNATHVPSGDECSPGGAESKKCDVYQCCKRKGTCKYDESDSTTPVEGKVRCSAAEVKALPGKYEKDILTGIEWKSEVKCAGATCDHEADRQTCCSSKAALEAKVKQAEDDLEYVLLAKKENCEMAGYYFVESAAECEDAVKQFREIEELHMGLLKNRRTDHTLVNGLKTNADEFKPHGKYQSVAAKYLPRSCSIFNGKDGSKRKQQAAFLTALSDGKLPTGSCKEYVAGCVCKKNHQDPLAFRTKLAREAVVKKNGEQKNTTSCYKVLGGWGVNAANQRSWEFAPSCDTCPEVELKTQDGRKWGYVNPVNGCFGCPNAAGGRTRYPYQIRFPGTSSDHGLGKIKLDINGKTLLELGNYSAKYTPPLEVECRESEKTVTIQGIPGPPGEMVCFPRESPENGIVTCLKSATFLSPGNFINSTGGADANGEAWTAFCTLTKTLSCQIKNGAIQCASAKKMNLTYAILTGSLPFVHSVSSPTSPSVKQLQLQQDGTKKLTVHYKDKAGNHVSWAKPDQLPSNVQEYHKKFNLCWRSGTNV